MIVVECGDIFDKVPCFYACTMWITVDFGRINNIRHLPERFFSESHPTHSFLTVITNSYIIIISSYYLLSILSNISMIIIGFYPIN